MTSDDDFDPQTVLYGEPRPLTAEERALVEWLVGQVAFPELSEQLETVRAIGYCTCGCPSVTLATDGPAVPADAMRAYNAAQREAFRRSSDDADEILGDAPPRDDWFEVRAEARSRRGRTVEVVLHGPDGLMFELEVWTGDTEHTATDLPAPSALSLV